MTAEEFYNKSRVAALKLAAEDKNNNEKWHEWDDLSEDEKAGWERKLAEESAPKKAADLSKK